jgi:hypothetical protein
MKAAVVGRPDKTNPMPGQSFIDSAPGCTSMEDCRAPLLSMGDIHFNDRLLYVLAGVQRRRN